MSPIFPIKKAAIIGSGVGGAAIAALLAKKGVEVQVFERNKFTGGKAASFEHNGFTFDMGVHFAARGPNGPLGEVAGKVGADLEFINHNPMFHLAWGDRSCTLPVEFTKLIPLAKMFMTSGVKFKSYWPGFLILRKLWNAKTPDDVKPYHRVPLKDFLYQYTDDPELHSLIAIICMILLTIPLEEASTGEFMWALSSTVRAASFAYPKGGFGHICNSYLSIVEKNNGSVHLNEGAQKIRVDNNRAVGIETEKGFYPADIIISNAGIKRTIELAGKSNFDSTFVEETSRLKSSLGGVTIKYALDYQPVDVPVTIYCEKYFDLVTYLDEIDRLKAPKENPPLFIPCPSLLDETLSPPGKHILIVGTAVPLNFKDVNLFQKIVENIEKKVMEIFPGIENHILYKHTTELNYIKNMSGRHEGDVIGLAQSYDQVGIKRPQHQCSIDALFLVGSDVGGNGVGTEMAADSALKLEQLIMDKYF